MAKAEANRLGNPMNTWPFVLLLLMPWSGYFHSRSSAAAVLGLENMLLMLALAFTALALQQITVALTARALGDRLLMFTIGVGPKLWSRYFAHHVVVVRAFPVYGLQTLVTTRKRGQRVRTALAITAGWAPFAVGLALIVVMHPASWTEKYALLARRLAPDSLFLYIAGWIALNGVFITIGALSGSRFFSNLDESVFTARRVLGHALEAEIQMSKGAYDLAVAAARRGLDEKPDDLLLQVNLAAALSMQGDPEAFALTEALSKRDLPPNLRGTCLNVRAWECYLRDDEALRDEADRASLEAVSSSPNQPAFLDTRGHVLMWNGRAAEAEQHLGRAFRLARSRSGRTSAASGMAILCANAGRVDEAVSWLARARAQDIQHPVLARAIALVEPLRRV